ncbi:MAG: stage 0 sporulation protein [Ruminococcaceae bacterium]|nr:stage 0 sporulation protein [Oscillospiraceae bacterium]
MIEIIGVRFKEAGKVYFFDPRGNQAKDGDCVIVETSRGMEFGFAASPNKFVPKSRIIPPLRPVIRIATKEDIDRYEGNKQLEKEAFPICQQKIKEHGLGMKLIEVEYTFDNSKLICYYSAESRVDFRELAKDLASVFRTRIELRQIGTRDEAKMIGGLGICGRPFCCSSFLRDFMQISIKMAKEQNLSLNSSKISGTCGKLMCCLRYEHETYEEEIRRTPPVDSVVKTADGVGTVCETSPLTGFIKVKFQEKGHETIKAYHRDDVTKIRDKGEKQ